MTSPDSPAAPQRAAVDAALVVLKSMGLSPGDLTAAPRDRAAVPTFAGYVPVVSATVTDGTRKAYGSYWNRVVEQWGTRRLDEPTPSEIKQLMAYVRANVVPRRNTRGGRSAAENLIAALRCLYKRAEEDGFIDERDNPACKVAKPRRLPSTRRAVADTRLAEINQVAATTGDDPELDTLILRLHTETACRQGGALALRPAGRSAGPSSKRSPDWSAGDQPTVQPDQDHGTRTTVRTSSPARTGEPARPDSAAPPSTDGQLVPGPLHQADEQALRIARALAAASKPVSRRTLRSKE
jgi:hypothetical protein